MAESNDVPHILLAEDIPTYMERMLALFGDMDLRMIRTYNGQEAIDHIEVLENRIDLLITDLDMPERNGWHVIEALRQHRGDIPIIMQTGEAAYPWVIAQAEETKIVLIDKIHVDIRLVPAVRQILNLPT
jgi:CheY-like chemotaxis protein